VISQYYATILGLKSADQTKLWQCSRLHDIAALGFNYLKTTRFRKENLYTFVYKLTRTPNQTAIINCTLRLL
jgi:hypothetical protein